MTGTLVLEARDLTRAFGPVTALAGLDLTVAAGELYGLVGPDGAGKTTAIRILAGLMAPDAGRVRILGEDPLGSSRVREALGYMPQAYSLYADLTVDENLRFFGRLFTLARSDYQARRQRLLAITRLAPFTERRAGALSGGMYKKLALACALLHRPRLLLLDEPTSGVDPVSRRELWALLGEFTAEGMAVLVSTPYMDEAERCHRVGLQHRGRLVAQGPPGVLVTAFPYGAFQVRGAAGAELEELLDRRPEVLSRSPQGGAPRIVVRPEGAAALAAALAPAGGLLTPVRPTFEDVFLARVREAGA